ncbi:multiple antibiotic resistance protein MarC [Vibrio sp. JCM 18905]|nr:multiple antibiotic resistance protein MarC [Vibrio sp. JCM 18905]
MRKINKKYYAFLGVSLIAIKMIFPSAGSITGLAAGEEPFIVPMAIPMIAGPSVIAALLLLSSQHPEKMLEMSASVVIAWGATFFILMFYGFFNRLLGERGLKAVERLMGLLLVMISTQMFLDGVKSYLG